MTMPLLVNRIKNWICEDGEAGNTGETQEYSGHEERDTQRHNIEYVDADYAATKRNAKYKSNVFDFQAAQPQIQAPDGQYIVITAPQNMEEASYICELVKNGKACIVNLENIPEGLSQRIADFIGGASHMARGDIQKVTGDIFVFAPFTTKISKDLHDELREKTQKRGLAYKRV